MMSETKISPLACVDSHAEIGVGVEIGSFAVVEAGAKIGDGSILHPHAVVRYGSTLGKGCEIHPNAVIGGVPQDLKFQGEDSTAILGDYTTVRECATVNRGTASRGTTIVGSHCLLMAYSHIAHDCVLGDHIIIGNATQIAGEVEIDDHAIISGGVLVHQFVRISQHVMIQGGSRLSKDIPPYVLVGRDPLVYCGINIVGLRRRNFTNEQIFLINDVYRTLYQRGLNNSDAIDIIQQEYADCHEKQLILDFIKSSKRGIVRGTME